MEMAMNGIGKHAGFYRGYLTDDRSFIPLTVIMATAIAVWLLFYLISQVGPVPTVGPASKGHAVVAPPTVTSTVLRSQSR
jgi:hypothetical protein